MKYKKPAITWPGWCVPGVTVLVANEGSIEKIRKIGKGVVVLDRDYRYNVDPRHIRHIPDHLMDGNRLDIHAFEKEYEENRDKLSIPMVIGHCDRCEKPFSCQWEIQENHGKHHCRECHDILHPEEVAKREEEALVWTAQGLFPELAGFLGELKLDPRYDLRDEGGDWIKQLRHTMDKAEKAMDTLEKSGVKPSDTHRYLVDIVGRATVLLEAMPKKGKRKQYRAWVDDIRKIVAEHIGI